MAQGFDTTEDCGPQAAAIKAAGYDFVARYLGQSSWKRITSIEATALKAAGLAIVLVYEDGPTTVHYFSSGRGEVDAARAALQANAIGAEAGTTIYFAVDYDASSSDLSDSIIPYFQAVASKLTSLAASGGPRYGVGVYGSGATCSAITGAGLASLGWLAQATRWSGYGTYNNWAISQGMPGSAVGMSVDLDIAQGSYGAM
ncbi:MAG TPA: glycoside hydrolase domain-containing protein [Stellaceae bacterium]|jgi:hypothetical protein|nr:glycoside hydrolase domain-containing protein [Stellaceae bacterium]